MPNAPETVLTLNQLRLRYPGSESWTLDGLDLSLKSGDRLALVGPSGCGKSTVIKSLVKHYTRHALSEVKGPITVVSGKKRRIQFIEVRNDLNDMVDAAKMADLVLLLVDGSYGFEMETFEFLNVLQVHGFPKVMGVLTHLDDFVDPKKLKKQKKTLKSRFWAEIYNGAKLFYLSGMQHGRYNKRDTLNLARFISTSKFRPLTWRTSHPYVVGDRFEDITPPGLVQANPGMDRDVAVYGWLHGCNLKRGQLVHVAGVGDCEVSELAELPDPCPLPSTEKKQRKLDERSKLLYAPMSDVGGLLYDKDAVYISMDDRNVNFSKRDGGGAGALLHARVDRVVFGAREPKAGAIVSAQRFFDQPFVNYKVRYEGGCLEAECSALMSGFFAMRRRLKRQHKQQG